MSLLNNPIGWANFQISGGPTRAAWVATGVAVVVPLLIFGTTQIEPDSFKRSMSFWYQMLCVIQGGILLFGLPGRVHGAMRRDRQSKLIESHRLMPTPAHHAVIGYILGPNLLLLACAAVLFFVGLFVASYAGEDLRGWLAMHVAFAITTASLCCLVAFSSQWLPRLNPALLLLFVGPVLSIGAFTVVPALGVMFGPIFSRLPQIQSGDLDPRVVVGGVAQVAFAAILFVGACRRYRRDDVPALGFYWGFALLALWVGMTLFAILGPRDTANWRRFDETSVATSYVVSVTLSMLLAIGPVASAAHAELAWRERRRIDVHDDSRRPVRVWAATTLVLALLTTLLLAAPRTVTMTVANTAAEAATPATVTRVVGGRTYAMPAPPQALTTTVHQTTWHELAMVFGILAVFVVTVGILAWAAGRVRVPVVAILAFWLTVTWALPPIVDGARVLLTGSDEAMFPGAVGAASPPFGLGAIWMGDLRSAGAGLIAQAALVPLLVTAWQLIKRHNASRGGLALPTAIANG